MSALGQKQTSRLVGGMSALPPKADIETQSRDVRFVPEADIALVIIAPNVGAQSGDAFVALNLAAVHHTSCPRIERVAAV
jgi:hypothetical protein